jgi:hypothetical protein
MVTVPDRRASHMHPAIRDRILRTSVDSRLKLLALSEAAAGKLDEVMAQLGSLTPEKGSPINDSNRQLLKRISELLRAISERLNIWAAGEMPTGADADLLVSDLVHCQNLLTEWNRLLENRGQSTD